MNAMKLLLSLIPIFGLMTLVGCGKDFGTSSNKSNTSNKNDRVWMVDFKDELPECSAKRLGLRIHVNELGLTYYCSDVGWNLRPQDNPAVDFDTDEDENQDVPVEPPYDDVPSYCEGGYSEGSTKTEEDSRYSYSYICIAGGWHLISQTPLPSVTPPSTAETCSGGAVDGDTKIETDGLYNYTYVCLTGSWFLLGQTPVTPVPSDPIIVPTSSSSNGIIKSSSSKAVVSSSSSKAVIKSSSSKAVVSEMLACAQNSIFCGLDRDYRVETGFDDGYEESGYWFTYGDEADGGASKIVWPVPTGNDYSYDALDPIIDECKGLCGTAVLNKGSLDYNPYVGVGFNLVNGFQDAADASAWGGICVVYTSDIALSVELGMGDVMDSYVGYDNPFVSLPKAVTGSSKCYAWSSFKQAGWGKGHMTGPEAARQLVALKFKVQAANGTTANFNIISVGKYN